MPRRARRSSARLIWRAASTRGGVHDPATSPVENGRYTPFARAGAGARTRGLCGETRPGNSPTPPDTVWLLLGSAFGPGTSVTYDINEPVVSWGLQCVGPTPASLCFTGDGALTMPPCTCRRRS